MIHGSPDVGALIAGFMADPTRGPRLYKCPMCSQDFEGDKPDGFFRCDGVEGDRHIPAVVNEIAVKSEPFGDVPIKAIVYRDTP